MHIASQMINNPAADARLAEQRGFATAATTSQVQSSEISLADASFTGFEAVVDQQIERNTDLTQASFPDMLREQLVSATIQAPFISTSFADALVSTTLNGISALRDLISSETVSSEYNAEEVISVTTSDDEFASLSQNINAMIDENTTVLEETNVVEEPVATIPFQRAPQTEAQYQAAA